jgi:hypothetical protein
VKESPVPDEPRNRQCLRDGQPFECGRVVLRRDLNLNSEQAQPESWEVQRLMMVQSGLRSCHGCSDSTWELLPFFDSCKDGAKRSFAHCQPARHTRSAVSHQGGRSDRKQRQRPSGALVPCAAAVVYGQATREEHDLTKDADGNFSTPGDYDLTVSRAAGDFENHRC